MRESIATLRVEVYADMISFLHLGQQGMIAHGGPRRGIGPPNQILMVSVSKIEYDITVDVLQQVR